MRLAGAGRIGVLQFISNAGIEYWKIGVVRSDTEGNPSPPSLKMSQPASFRLLWPVSGTGTHTFSIDVKQAANQLPRPQIVVKANADIGINADVIVVASNETGFTTVGPAIVVPTADGVLDVLIQSVYCGSYADCFWDNASVT